MGPIRRTDPRPHLDGRCPKRRIWRSFDNKYWPAHYFTDAKGRTRFHHFGEGEYDQSEQEIQQLLEEAGNGNVPQSLVTVNASGVEAAAIHARDLHLVLGPAADGKPIRFRVTIDGKAPGVDHGTDTDTDGQGVVDSQRLYQLVRQNGVIKDRTFAIEFLDPGVHAYAFTFG